MLQEKKFGISRKVCGIAAEDKPVHYYNKNIMTTQEIEKLGFRLQPDGSYSKPTPTHAKKPASPTSPPRSLGLQSAQPQHPAGPTLDEAKPRKTKGKNRIICRITRYSPRLLDADNFVGGCKPLIDQLRYANLIPDDDPESIELQFVQHRASKSGIRTEIEILNK